MAWRAEYKRRNWNCVIGWDAISWYAKYLYDEWLKSLTPAQIKRLEECHQKEKENKKSWKMHSSILWIRAMSLIDSGYNTREKIYGKKERK